tara:strand:+ start:8492 stop:8671 length:180 start_codon:yes stop_codon:yes gene_type:complete
MKPPPAEEAEGSGRLNTMSGKWVEWKDFSPSGFAKSKKKDTKWISLKSGKSYYWKKSKK